MKLQNGENGATYTESLATYEGGALQGKQERSVLQYKAIENEGGSKIQTDKQCREYGVIIYGRQAVGSVSGFHCNKKPSISAPRKKNDPPPPRKKKKKGSHNNNAPHI